MRYVRIGTRGSRLALTQTEIISSFLRRNGYDVVIKIIATTGDRMAEIPVDKIPERGIFASAIENALLAGEIDIAVHSLKDLPGGDTPGLTLAAVPTREDPRDVLVGRTAPTIEELPSGAVIGTSSMRRRAELLRIRQDITIAEMRGNIDTRIRKLDAGKYDAVCLAGAGLHRLEMRDRITQYFEIADVIPAPGQGALAVQTRHDNCEMMNILADLHDPATFAAVQIERRVLTAIGGGCSAPIGIHVQLFADDCRVNAARYSPGGKPLSRISFTMPATNIDEVVAAILRKL